MSSAKFRVPDNEKLFEPVILKKPCHPIMCNATGMITNRVKSLQKWTYFQNNITFVMHGK